MRIHEARITHETAVERHPSGRSRVRSGAVLTAAIVLGAACQDPDRRARTAAATGAEWTIETARVIHTATRDGNSDLWLLDRATGSSQRLTADPAADNFARLSPDASRIAFQSARAGTIDIFLMDADGANVVNLTTHPDFDVLPAWSPDGSRLAFMSTRGDEAGPRSGSFPGHIWVMDADGSNLRRLTREPLTSSLGPQDWAPDGRTILLSREDETGLDLYLLDVGSGDETRLSSDPADEYGAAFSRDGGRIAFHAEADGVSHIVVMNRDGTGRRVLTTGPGLRYSPRWSPDDAWLLFTAQGSGGGEEYDIRAIRVADGHEIAIVATSDDERYGDWEPVRR